MAQGFELLYLHTSEDVAPVQTMTLQQLVQDLKGSDRTVATWEKRAAAYAGGRGLQRTIT